MGTLWGGNGDEQPPGGGGSSDGMPGVPPEWGPVVIPDDASALDAEALAVRRELRRTLRRHRWRRRLRLSAPSGADPPSLAVPLVIMGIAVLATMISLFAVAWPGGYNRNSPGPDTVTTKARPLSLPDLPLRDIDGGTVKIRDMAPAVIILVDGCRCDGVIADAIATVDPRVSVLVVITPDPSASASATLPGDGPWRPGSSTAPGEPDRSGGPARTGGPGAQAGPAPGTSTTEPGELNPTDVLPGSGPRATSSGAPTRSGPPGVRVRTLVDPGGVLRAQVPGLPADGGVILLVSADWAVVQVVPASRPIGELKPDLDRLAR